MFGNLFILLIVIALTAVGGWLTWRAFKAQRLWVKIAGGIGGVLLTLLFGAIAFTGARGVAAVYFPGADPAPELTVAGSPEQIARGEYLVNLSCIGCHSAVGPDGNPTGQHPLSGGWNIAAAEGFGFMGDLVTENLTPGGKLASYSDGELFRALRQGYSSDGHVLGMMAEMPYKELSDADTEAIIAYLRSLEPVTQTAETGDSYKFTGAVLIGSGMFPQSPPGQASIAAPAEGVSAEYGRYVATYGDCRGCHGPDMTGTPESIFGPAVPNPRPLVSELTYNQFAEMMRTGIKPDGQAFPETMPWQIASRLTDNDLQALYTYLTAPVEQ